MSLQTKAQMDKRKKEKKNAQEWPNVQCEHTTSRDEMDKPLSQKERHWKS